jgi:hypothetical protein
VGTAFTSPRQRPTDCNRLNSLLRRRLLRPNPSLHLFTSATWGSVTLRLAICRYPPPANKEGIRVRGEGQLKYPELTFGGITRCLAVVTLAVDPHLRPSGSCPQLTPARYGLGRSFRAPSSDAGGSRTGYRPGGNTGVARWPLAAVVASGGTPQECANGPGEP